MLLLRSIRPRPSSLPIRRRVRGLIHPRFLSAAVAPRRPASWSPSSSSPPPPSSFSPSAVASSLRDSSHRPSGNAAPVARCLSDAAGGSGYRGEWSPPPPPPPPPTPDAGGDAGGRYEVRHRRNPMYTGGGGRNRDGGYSGAEGRGRNGTYIQTEFSLPVDDDVRAKIEEKLDERSRAKRERDFSLADSIQNDLRDEYGVRIDERRKRWWVVDEERPYSFLREYSKPVDDDRRAEIQEKVDEGARAKNSGDFALANTIRKELRDKFGARFDARRKTWWVVDGDRPYVLSKFSLPVEDDVRAVIQEKVDERARAKVEGDYTLADTIEEKLFAEFDVRTDDRRRTWWAGDRKRPYALSKFSRPIDDENLRAMIQEKVDERAVARRRRDVALASSIKSELRLKYDVRFDERRREWWIGDRNRPYVYVASSASSPHSHLDLDEGVRATIQGLVDERARAKRERNFPLADCIQEELLDEFGVSFDDANKTWWVMNYRNRGD